MKGLKKFAIVFLILIGSGLLIYNSKIGTDILLTEERKIEDFNYLYNTIKENYPFLEVNKRLNNVDWLSKKEEYLQKIKNTETDDEFLMVLDDMLSELNNGHTNMITDSKQFKFFREVYTMSKGWQKKVQLPVINNRKALARYNVDKNQKIAVVDEGKNGEIKGVKNASVKDIEEGKIGYIRIPQMISYYNMNMDIELIDEYLDKCKDYEAMVIDIRGNGGGDSGYWMFYLLPKLINKSYTQTTYCFWKDGDLINNFIKKSKLKYENDFGEVKDLNTKPLTNLPPEVKKDFKYYCKNTIKMEPSEESINFKRSIYLLVDKGVYSSSEILASFAKESGFATLIGETTGGDGIGSDPLLGMLPNSGYVFRFSKDMGVTSDGTCNEEFKTKPDYFVENPWVNTFEHDKCIKKVLELEEK
ncbi:S41 family peptidase [Terrisporobacter glycolicus]|uniref:Peptidase family S41 n=1 Tax=Terrisporobacter glycolicus ATCC 14880 = DSM 1288 TaxID=1121315 RepID=A0ABZ2EWA8_9FIRM|nr:S41 family peptidase [Terrisporobacter glycolicus]